MRLAGDEVRDTACQSIAAADLVGRPFGKADIAHLAALDGAGQRLHRLLERRVPVVAVALVEIDEVGAQPPQRGIELLFDLAAREAAVAVGHREEELGGEDVGVARAALQRLAEEGLGGAAAVDVGGVDEVDADLEGASRQARAASASTPTP